MARFCLQSLRSRRLIGCCLFLFFFNLFFFFNLLKIKAQLFSIENLNFCEGSSKLLILIGLLKAC